MATGRPTRFKRQHRGSVTHSTSLHMHSKLVVLGEYWIMVSFCEKWLTMDALCHTKFVNHHCWFDALALIMQTGYEVSSLSVPVVIDYTFKEYLPLFICARDSSTPFYHASAHWRAIFIQQVRPSVCPSVTFRYQMKTAQHIVTGFSPYRWG